MGGAGGRGGGGRPAMELEGVVAAATVAAKAEEREVEAGRRRWRRW